jgi:hypothetical protein
LTVTVSPARKRHRSRNIDVGLDAQHEIALLGELEKKAFVVATRAVARAEDGKHGALSNDFGIARAAGIECADVRVVGLFRMPSAATGECKQAEGER